MSPTDECETVGPLLFAALEDDVTESERRRIQTHLALCPACRELERAERRLNRLLLDDPASAAAPRSRRRLRLLAATAAAAVLLVVSFGFLAGEPAYGSIESRTLTATLTWEGGESSELRASNHVHVPSGRSSTVAIRSVGGIRAAGPAVFELDHVESSWKLVLLRGQVAVDLEPQAALVVASRYGRRRLVGGEHVVALTPRFFEQEEAAQAGEKSVAELIDQGSRLFALDAPRPTPARLAEGEEALRRAAERKEATPDEKNHALFYLAAIRGRQKKYAEALAAQSEWLKLFPKDGARHYVLLFHGVCHDALGHRRAAEKAWSTIVSEAPGSSLAEHARRHLGHVAAVMSRGARPAKAADHSAPTSKPGGYLVVTVALRKVDRGFHDVAKRAAAFHEGAVVPFDGRRFDALARTLKQHAPRNVLFVLRPETLDVNLQRRILLLSADLDDDIFPDFAYGYLTARDGKTLRALWKRTRALHRRGLASKTWIRTAVSSAAKSTTYRGFIPAIARAAGFEGTQYLFGTRETDPDFMKFVDDKLPALEEASVISMTGNGDPQGIWLFSDRRNMDRSRHWPYERERVGHDPENEMPRITADRFRRLRLKGPIVWSGTCHSAATGRVFVEGDIVSTFGRTDRTTVHELEPDESLCLALFDAGATALLAPVAANHGMSVSMEVEFALRHGATLGETIKSTYDDVFLAAGGDLVLDLPEAGRPKTHEGPVMQGGGANRILIGDPALAPFTATESPAEKVEVEKTQDGFTVTVTRKPGFQPRGWDIFGTDHDRSWRIYVRIPLDGRSSAVEQTVSWHATVEAKGPQGKTLPYEVTHCRTESHHGRTYLHLQANAPRAAAERIGSTAVFTVVRGE